MITEESMKKAQQAQADYWSTMLGGLEFFRKCEPDETVLEMYNFSFTVSWPVHYRQSLADGYEVIARYWLSKYLDSAVNFAWCAMYQMDIRAGLGWKAAMARADEWKKSTVKLLKERYP